MFYDNKRLCIMTGEPPEYSPKGYIDWFYIRPKKRTQRWVKHKSFYFYIGMFNCHLMVELKWGYIKGEIK